LRLSPNYCMITVASCNQMHEKMELTKIEKIGYRIYQNSDGRIVGIFENYQHIEPLLSLAPRLNALGLSKDVFLGAPILGFGEKLSELLDQPFNIIIIDDNDINSIKVDYPEEIEVFTLIGNKTIVLYPTNRWKSIDHKFKIKERILGSKDCLRGDCFERVEVCVSWAS
jgi:hypothetical protein